MPLPSSGSISMSQVNAEIGNLDYNLSGNLVNQSIGFGHPAVRHLFNRPSGQISLSDGFGKTYNIEATGDARRGVVEGKSYILFLGSGTIKMHFSKNVEVLACGGGGAGGGAGGGGGGGGAVLNYSTAMLKDRSYSIIIGGGGSFSGLPTTGIPTSGNRTEMYEDGKLIMTCSGGGHGGSRNNQYRNGGNGNAREEPTLENFYQYGMPCGGGAAAYSGSVAGQFGGNGLLYYGGGGGAGSNLGGRFGGGPANASAKKGGDGANGYSVTAFTTRTESGINQYYRLGGGGGGSGSEGASGSGGANKGGGAITGYAGRQGVGGIHAGLNAAYTPSGSVSTEAFPFYGGGGGGGAYATTDASGAVGGNGSGGFVLLRWNFNGI